MEIRKQDKRFTFEFSAEEKDQLRKYAGKFFGIIYVRTESFVTVSDNNNMDEMENVTTVITGPVADIVKCIMLLNYSLHDLHCRNNKIAANDLINLF